MPVVLSTISGGSITGACYSTRGGTFEEFYNDLYSGLQTKNAIKALIFSAHQLENEWVEHPRAFEKEITEFLEARTNYHSIIKPTAEEKSIARSVGTNLTALTKIQTDCLIKQAEALTELQVKLYCPLLVYNKF